MTLMQNIIIKIIIRNDTDKIINRYNSKLRIIKSYLYKT